MTVHFSMIQSIVADWIGLDPFDQLVIRLLTTSCFLMTMSSRTSTCSMPTLEPSVDILTQKSLLGKQSYPQHATCGLKCFGRAMLDTFTRLPRKWFIPLGA